MNNFRNYTLKMTISKIIQNNPNEYEIIAIFSNKTN